MFTVKRWAKKSKKKEGEEVNITTSRIYFLKTKPRNRNS